MKKIVFLLGSANISGGTYVILQHAQHLQKLGHQVTIALVYMTLEEFMALKHSSHCWHPAITELSFISIHHCSQHQFDIAIFTWWATTYSYEKINARQFVYFVQSIESRFYPAEITFKRDLAERTYQLGLPIITEATWIQKYLQRHYHYTTNCQLVKNGILKSVYTEHGTALAEKSTTQLRILVEGPVEILYKNVARTIALCKAANVGEIWLLTSTPMETCPCVTRVFSKVPITKVPEIYRSCDVLVKLSYVEGMFGPPLEMFHCGGTAIVYDVTGYDEYIEHNVNALVAKKDDEQTVVKYLKSLHQDRNLLARLSAGAKETAKKWIDWEQSSNEFANALENIPQPESFMDPIRKFLLTEHIEVIVIKNNQHSTVIVEANVIYHSGQYLLKMSIDAGETQLGFAFGKLYQRLFVLGVNVYSDDHSNIIGQINQQMHEITQNPDQSFNCTAESSMLFMNININSTGLNTKYYLELKFAPVAIREALLPELV